MEQSADPPPFDPLAPAVPISYPLKTLAELESREYFKSFHFPFNQAATKHPGWPASPPRRRILVCHDFKGGYTDDRFVQGGANAEAYTLWHWYLMDVFVYFSHNLVTLPPPCYTNTAHKHGVKVLGTFIMEGDDGTELLKKLLSTKASAHMYAERLTELAFALGFDGWLINLEVDADPKLIPILENFVSHLTQTMHTSVPGSLVIWYDSISTDGTLSWQNQLNASNKPFFDQCDGIFVNYFWEEDALKLSADVAGDRRFDVYMGIDVYGRGTFGGGEWDTHVALDVIKKYSLSTAIFAPGWVYETNQPPDFTTAQNRWWGLVEKSWGTLQKYPTSLPFYSNFDQGRGYHISIDGEQVWSLPWNNMSSQSFQPLIMYRGDDSPQPIQVSIGLKEASYSGGGNITFKGTLGKGNEFTARLFKGGLRLGNFPVHFTYSVKLSGNSLLGIALESHNASNERMSFFLAASGSTESTLNHISTHHTHVITPHSVTKIEANPGWVMLESRINLKGHVLREIQAVCYTSKPRKSEYLAILGDIKITKSGASTKFPPSASWLVDGQFISWTSGPKGSKFLSLKITWKLKDGSPDIFSKYNIYVRKLASKMTGNYSGLVEGAQDYLGVASVKSFYVSNLEVASGVSSLKFLIQACGLDGALQKLEDSPLYLLQVQGTKIMKEQCLPCKCGRKITVMVSENFENSGKVFDCYYIHGHYLNVDGVYRGDNGSTADTMVEGQKMLQRYAEMDKSRVVQTNETRGELYVVYVLLVLSFIVLAIWMYCISFV